jgi:biopolymer transport protein ExbD
MSTPGNPPPSSPAAGPVPPAAAGSEIDGLFGDPTHHEEVHKKKKKRHKGHEKSVSELNLTAMMDMMTIILVFLIKNFATESNQIDKKIMSPPRSSSKIRMESAVTVTITKLGVSVNDKVIADFDGMSTFKFKGEPPDTSQPIEPLRARLDIQVADLKKLEQLTGGKKAFEGKILVIADEKTPYSFLMRVLYTAGLAQFSQYKLIVRSKTE